jgi:hypothetical protein
VRRDERRWNAMGQRTDHAYAVHTRNVEQRGTRHVPAVDVRIVSYGKPDAVLERPGFGVQPRGLVCRDAVPIAPIRRLEKDVSGDLLVDSDRTHSSSGTRGPSRLCTMPSGLDWRSMGFCDRSVHANRTSCLCG